MSSYCVPEGLGIVCPPDLRLISIHHVCLNARSLATFFRIFATPWTPQTSGRARSHERLSVVSVEVSLWPCSKLERRNIAVVGGACPPASIPRSLHVMLWVLVVVLRRSRAPHPPLPAANGTANDEVRTTPAYSTTTITIRR